MMTKQNLHSDLAIPPGEYLEEVLEDLSMSQAELARRTGRPTQAINEIIKGSKAITPDTALQLEKVTSVPAYLWTSLEEEYRLTLARQEEQKQLEQEAEVIDPERFDPKLYNAMAKQSWVKKAGKKSEKIRELLRFFGVSSIYNLDHVKTYSPAFRVDQTVAVHNYALAAWLRKGELEAREIEAELQIHAFNLNQLKSLIPELRSLTLEPPEAFVPQVQSHLAECGVILIILPHLPKTGAHGATFWLTPKKVVVQLSIRRKWADIFWFSLFHELAHVVLHGKRDTFVTLEDKNAYSKSSEQKLEKEADVFASNALIPLNKYKEFISQQLFTEVAISAFAERVGIDKGIVVGRLQHDGYLNHNQMNDLRSQYTWVEAG